MPKFIIHVNMHHIRENVKTGENLPPYTIKIKEPRKKVKTVYAWTFDFDGKICGENHMNDPLNCGARIYLTANEGVLTLYDIDGKIFNGLTPTEAKALYGDKFSDSTLQCSLKS